MNIESRSETDTYEFGKKLGEGAAPGQVYCLDGDLGAGKTVFTRGFAAGLGADDIVCSPTFTIIHEYKSGRLPLYHFDVYRFEDPDEIYELGYEEYFYGQGVCLIEWASMIEDFIPESAIHVTIKRNMKEGPDYRLITVEDNNT